MCPIRRGGLGSEPKSEPLLSQSEVSELFNHSTFPNMGPASVALSHRCRRCRPRRRVVSVTVVSVVYMTAAREPTQAGDSMSQLPTWLGLLSTPSWSLASGSVRRARPRGPRWRRRGVYQCDAPVPLRRPPRRHVGVFAGVHAKVDSQPEALTPDT
jgi:hypothetical protein